VKAVVLVRGRGIEQVDFAAKLLGRLAEELAGSSGCSETEAIEPKYVFWPTGPEPIRSQAP
jgi:hypothetical protein